MSKWTYSCTVRSYISPSDIASQKKPEQAMKSYTVAFSEAKPLRFTHLRLPLFIFNI